MTTDPTIFFGPLLVLAVFIGMLLFVARRVADQARKDGKLTPLPRSYHLQRCECTAAMQCPQGRDPANGDPYQCKIWVQDEEGIN